MAKMVTIKGLVPELTEQTIVFSEAEKRILREAHAICKRTGELQTQLIESDGDEDDGRDNPYEWARIYLSQVLE